MKTNQALKEIATKLAEVRAIISVTEWNDDQINDIRLGEHLTAFEQHLDNAQGRLGTVARCASKLNA